MPNSKGKCLVHMSTRTTAHEIGSVTWSHRGSRKLWTDCWDLSKRGDSPSGVRAPVDIDVYMKSMHLKVRLSG